MNDMDVIMLVMQILILVGSFLVGRFVMPQLNSSGNEDAIRNLKLIMQYAEAYIQWAKKFLPNSTGAAKMESVVSHLISMADKNGIDVSKEDLQAITQLAYDKIKHEEQLTTDVLSATTELNNVLNENNIEELDSSIMLIKEE